MDPYAYKFIDSRVYKLYNVLSEAFTIFHVPNTSLVLSKLRRFSLHEKLDPQIREKAISLDKTVGEVTLRIFQKGLRLVKNSKPYDSLFAYAAEQNERIKEVLMISAGLPASSLSQFARRYRYFQEEKTRHVWDY